MRSRSAGFIGATSIALANASALVLDAATQDWNSASSASVGVSFNRNHQAAASRSVDDEALPPGHSSSLIDDPSRSEEHTSELQSLMRISYAVFCLKKKKIRITQTIQST